MKYNHRTRKYKRKSIVRKGGNPTQTVLQTETKLQSPISKTRHLILRSPPVPEAPVPEQFPVPAQALLEQNPEQPQIHNAPTLEKLKQEVSEYTYSYLKGVLRRIADGDLHRRYIDESETDTIFVFIVSEIINLLDAEIAELMDTYSSGEYTFGPNDRDRVVQELEAYKSYFQTYQLQPPQIDRINMDYHEALFH